MKTYLEILEDYTTLETNRLILRPFSMEDAPSMFEYASDPETVRHLVFEPHQTLQDSKDIIPILFLDKPGTYAITLKENFKMIGAIDIRTDDENQKASFGYVLNKKYWNKGYMSEALNCILKICFETLKTKRVESTHYEKNPASGKVMQKCGMKYEGMGKNELIIKGNSVNVLHYAILSEEWFS